MSRRWLHRCCHRRQRSFLFYPFPKQKKATRLCRLLLPLVSHSEAYIRVGRKDHLSSVCIRQMEKRGFAFGMSVLESFSQQPLLSHFLFAFSPFLSLTHTTHSAFPLFSVICFVLLLSNASIHVHCTKIKTSLHLMCVDYVCQWGRLKVIICGLRLNKCAFYLLFYTLITHTYTTHTHTDAMFKSVCKLLLCFFRGFPLSMVLYFTSFSISSSLFRFRVKQLYVW